MTIGIAADDRGPAGPAGSLPSGLGSGLGSGSREPLAVARGQLEALAGVVEDGIAEGGVGSRLAQKLRESGIDVATRELGIPTNFLPHGKVADVRAHVGLTIQDLGRRIVEWSALVQGDSEPGSDVHAARRAGDVDGT